MDGNVLATLLFIDDKAYILDWVSTHIPFVIFFSITVVGWYSIGTVLVNNLLSVLRIRIEAQLTLQLNQTHYDITTIESISDTRLYRDCSLASSTVEALLNGYVRFIIRVVVVGYFSFKSLPLFSYWVIGSIILGFFSVIRYCVVMSSLDFQIVERAYRTVWIAALDLLRSMTLIRGARQEKIEQLHLTKLIDTYYRTYLDWNTRFVLTHLWQHSVFFCGILLGWMLTYDIDTTTLSDLETLEYFVIMWLWVGNHLRVTTNASAVLFYGLPTLTRVLELQNIVNKSTTDTTTSVVNMTPGVLVIQAVNYVTEIRDILKDVTLTIPSGSVIGLISSADEATCLANIAARRYLTSSGEVLLQDKPITSWSQYQIDQMITYVGQTGNLLHRSILNNLTYGSEHSVTTNQVAELLHVLNLSDLITRFPDGLNTILDEATLVKLTNVEKHLLVVGRALLTPSPILILDHALDQVSLSLEIAIIQYICKLPRLKTVILVPSRWLTLHNVDCLYLFDNTNLLSSGQHYALLDTNAVYRQLYFSQIRLSLISQTPKRG